MANSYVSAVRGGVAAAVSDEDRGSAGQGLAELSGLRRVVLPANMFRRFLPSGRRALWYGDRRLGGLL